MEELGVDPTSDGFGNTVTGHGPEPPEPDLEHSRFVLHQEPNGLATEPPLPRQVGNRVVPFKRCVDQLTGKSHDVRA